MSAAELAAHKTSEHGRDYRLSGDGYDDMDLAEKAGWRVIPSWGRDGWDLGDWPYVAIYTRDAGDAFELMVVVEGDHTVYRFSDNADLIAAIDYLFLWYAAGKRWAPLTWEQRGQLDAGELQVDEKFRGGCG
jgi:hypothetical protein